ncbi:MAG: cysteine desulfurase [Pseudomonadota bacterium]|nr:cysteine desulfurase [Pseudomonadota bacterium]
MLQQTLDIDRIRADFPILGETVHGRPLAYLDNAATAQKPRAVIEAVARHYRHDNANVFRGVHALAERATGGYEHARERVRAFINAGSKEEIVFLRGTTEAINLVANSFGNDFREGDEILITAMEHHANIVPWQMACERTGAKLRIAPMDRNGELIMEAFEKLLTPRTRIVSVVHISNALGTINPVEEIIKLAHAQGAQVLLDGAQSAPHMALDMQALDADFYAFSGHKLFGPTGIGVLYGKRELLEKMPPWQGGGEMIRTVTFEKSTWNDLPYKFEAGTPNIAGAIGLGAAIDYVDTLGMERLVEREHRLLEYATDRVQEIPDLRIIGEAENKASVLSMVMSDVHPHDLGTILDSRGIAIRAGHHCAMPVMQFFGIPATTRASLAFYNTEQEIDRLVDALNYAREVLL